MTEELKALERVAFDADTILRAKPGLTSNVKSALLAMAGDLLNQAGFLRLGGVLQSSDLERLYDAEAEIAQVVERTCLVETTGDERE